MKERSIFDEGGPAFPVQTRLEGKGAMNGEVRLLASGYSGLTVRDWFAGQALAGLVLVTGRGLADVAHDAYVLADAMLAERRKPDACSEPPTPEVIH